MAIRKGSFTFVFLFDDACDPEPVVRNMDIQTIFNECDDGTMIGHLAEAIKIESVESDKVAEELWAMGNDGTFFNES